MWWIFNKLTKQNVQLISQHKPVHTDLLSKYAFFTLPSICAVVFMYSGTLPKKLLNLFLLLTDIIPNSLWSKSVLLPALWGEPDPAFHTGAPVTMEGEIYLSPPEAVIQLGGWKAVISSVYVWMSDRRSLGRWSENWGEIAGQSSPGGALGSV